MSIIITSFKGSTKKEKETCFNDNNKKKKGKVFLSYMGINLASTYYTGWRWVPPDC